MKMKDVYVRIQFYLPAEIMFSLSKPPSLVNSSFISKHDESTNFKWCVDQTEVSSFFLNICKFK